MHIQRHSQLLRHRRERTTPRARHTPSAPLSRDREKGDGIETERWLLSGVYSRKRARGRRGKRENEREREKDAGDRGGVRKGACRGAHDFLHILRWLLCRRSKITKRSDVYQRFRMTTARARARKIIPTCSRIPGNDITGESCRTRLGRFPSSSSF